MLLLLCIMAMQGYAQQRPKPKTVVEITDEEKVFTKVDPEASTDTQKWEEHMRKRIVLPDSVIQKIPQGSYVAMVSFIIDKLGNAYDFKLHSDPGYGLGKIALRAVKSYTGEWKPAVQCGRLVNAYVKRPVKFVIQ